MTGWRRTAFVALVACAAGCADGSQPGQVAGTVWLTTEPLDRSELVSGHTVGLRYVIASPSGPECQALLRAGEPSTIYVRLEARGPFVRTPDDENVPVSQTVGCRGVPPAPLAGERWIAGRISQEAGATRRVIYGIERFTIPAQHALGPLPTGSVVAKVTLNEHFEARVVELITLRQH